MPESAEIVLLVAVRRALLALVGALEMYLKARGVEVLSTQRARGMAMAQGKRRRTERRA